MAALYATWTNFRLCAVVHNRARSPLPAKPYPSLSIWSSSPSREAGAGAAVLPRSWWAGPAHAGPRSGVLCPHQLRVEGEVVAELARHEEVLPDVLLALASYGAGAVRALEDLHARIGGFRDGVDEDAAARGDLHRDAADPARHHRPRLPERLGHHEAEALADGFLDHDIRYGLEGVDLYGADVGQVGEQEDVLVPVGVVDGPVPVVPALGVVVGHRA